MNPIPNHARGLARNTTLILAGRLGAQGLLVLATVILARRLGVNGFAGYALLVAVVALANVATTFGTDLVLIRELAAGGHPGRWRSALAVQVGLSVPAIAAMWLVAPFLPWPSTDGADALRIYAFALLPMAVASVGTAVLRGRNAMGRYAVVGAAGAAVQLAAIAVVVTSAVPLTTVAWTLLAVQVVVALLTWAVAAATVAELRRIQGVGWGRRPLADMTATSLPIGVLGLLGTLYQRAPVLVLAAVAGPAGTAWFAAASRVAEVSKTGHSALFSAAFPIMSARADHAALRWSWRVSVGTSVLLAVALALLSPLVIDLLYGPDFAPATPALAILAVSIVPATAGTYRALAALAAHREPVVLAALLVGLGLLGGLLVILVPTVGWLGAAWAVLVAESGQLAVLLAADRIPRTSPRAPRIPLPAPVDAPAVR
jgi:O-antigen/teichoic acid export membrane protein